MPERFSQRFWDTVCPFRRLVYVQATIFISLLLLLLFSLRFSGGDPASRALVRIDVVIIAVGLLLTLYIGNKCGQRDR